MIVGPHIGPMFGVFFGTRFAQCDPIQAVVNVGGVLSLPDGPATLAAFATRAEDPIE